MFDLLFNLINASDHSSLEEYLQCGGEIHEDTITLNIHNIDLNSVKLLFKYGYGSKINYSRTISNIINFIDSYFICIENDLKLPDGSRKNQREKLKILDYLVQFEKE